MQMAETFNCPTCGGPLEYLQGNDIAIRCRYCQNTVIVPQELRRGHLPGKAISEDGHPQLNSATSHPVDLQQLEKEIRTYVASRQKITAIKVFRNVTGAGLKDAKEAVEAVEAGGSLDASRLPPSNTFVASPAEDAATLSQAAQLIREGKQIAAIRLLRNRYDISLKVAKEAADLLEKGENVDIQWLKMRASQSAVMNVNPPAESPIQGNSVSFPWVVILLVLLVGIFLILAVGFLR
jgi:LSD1 subclass zinc finger protein